MNLKFKFEYLSNNNTLITYLNNICKSYENEIEYKILKDGAIFLYVKAKEEELIEFSNYLNDTLPLSMFFNGTTAEVVSQIPNQSSLDIKWDNKLPFCPSCLKKIEDSTLDSYYNPFLSCKICGTTCVVDSLKLKKDDELLSFNSNKELFEQVAKLISENKSIKIKTQSGSFVFKKLQETKQEVKVLALNLNTISSLVVASKKEIVTLASIEKPSIDLKINAIFKQKNILEQDFVNIRYVNDLVLFLLAKELEAYGIDFLAYDENSSFDYELTFDSQIKNIDIPKVKVLEDKLVIISSNSYDKKLDEVYNKFEEESKGHFMVLLNEYDFFEKSVINFYSSSKKDDNIALYSTKFDGLLDILNFEIPNNFEEIFQEFKKEDTSSRLLENYKNKFPKNYENAINCDLSKLKEKNVFTLWKIVSVVLGFDDKITSTNTLFENAVSSVLEKGPRIDYKFKHSDKFYNKYFLINKLIQSGMSYKLAGVDDKTLSLGYIESYAHFIARIVDDVHNEVELDAITLSGDIFANELIARLTKKSITKNFKVYYNKDFPVQK